MSILCLSLGCFASSRRAAGLDDSIREVSFPTSDGGRVVANLSGTEEHAVVLAHRAVFDKESWAKQAETLTRSGLRVLAIDFRGYGKSKAGSRPTALHLETEFSHG